MQHKLYSNITLQQMVSHHLFFYPRTGGYEKETGPFFSLSLELHVISHIFV